MYLRNLCVLLILSILRISFLFSQEDSLECTKKITISDGLAHNGVSSVLEDSKGYLWIGTYQGLNKYDGVEITTYKNTIDNRILTSNRIRTISEDLKGNLWIGTEEGLTIYDTNLEKFQKVYFNTKNDGLIIRNILIDDNYDLIYCLTEDNGILIFDKKYNLIEKVNPQEVFSKNQIKLYQAVPLNDKSILIASSTGLFTFNIYTKQLKSILEKEIKVASSILKLNNTSFLVLGTNGILHINFEKDTFTLKSKFLKDYEFNSIRLDAKNNLWLGTFREGVVQIKDFSTTKTQELKLRIKTFTDNIDRLRVSSIVASENNIWISTFNKGLYQFSVSETVFKTPNKSTSNKKKISSTWPLFISKYDDNRALIVNVSGDLALYNTSTHVFEELPFSIPSNEKIDAVFVDKKKNVWFKIIGKDALFIVEREKLTIRKISHPKLLGSDLQAFRSFSEDKYGNIWIATHSEIYKINLQNLNLIEVETLSSNPSFKDRNLKTIRKVYADPLKDIIWVGTAQGFYRLEYKQNVPLKDLKISRYVKEQNSINSISSNFVTDVLRLPNKELWVTTENGGVCKVVENNESLQFIPFTEKVGLSNNAAKNILFDNDSGLWISTNIGLNRFDLKTKQFRKFNLADGLPFEDFWFASEKLDNGIFFFSGLKTFCYFNPKDILKTEKLPKVHLSNFKIFNKTVKPNDTINGRVLLKKSISKKNKLNLRYDENVFSFDLISLHFSNPKNHFIKYKLSGINKDWIEVTSDNNNIKYSGLQPGDYEFSYMVSNSLNEWTQLQKLLITITPPFWETGWAYFIYFILLILLILLIVSTITKIQSLNHKVEIEKLELSTIKGLNESKLRFFSNISHEIKTPITLISSPVDTLADRYKNNSDVSQKLNLIKRQVKKIHQLIDQAHDFRRADANLLKMNYSRFNFNIFIEELVKDFKFLANKDEKVFILNSNEKNIIVSADKDKVEKIINNLISNAFKYTKKDDSIKIEFLTKEKNLIIKVSDTGMGIDEEDLEFIFERFYQSKSTYKEHIAGSGIGLAFSKKLVEMHYGYIDVESKINEGTTFIIQLPVVKQQIEADEIVDEAIILPEEKEIIIDKKILQQDVKTEIKINEEFSNTLIFYAEDNLEMRNYVSNVLSKYFTIKSFRNGQELLDALEDEWPDIVISDVQMPILNGLELCINIKSDLKTSHIPVILLTALSNIEDHVKGIRDGADAYIKKPFNLQRLVTNVEALLKSRKQLRERFQVGIPLTKENKNNRNDNAFLEKLYSIIDENIDNQDFDINSLSRELYLNRTHFYQKVKELTNQTPFEILKTYRLKRAAKLLAQENLTVNEVFIMTGFKNRHHFSKTFKKMYNISPSKYGEEMKNKFN